MGNKRLQLWILITMGTWISMPATTQNGPGKRSVLWRPAEEHSHLLLAAQR